MPFDSVSMPPDFPYRDVFLRGRPQHPEYDAFRLKHPVMDCGHRAKIFSPFDALRGFDLELTAAETRQMLHESPGGEHPEALRTDEIFYGRAASMCCRYYVDLSPELRPIIEEANRSPLREKMVNALGKPLVTSGEIFPTNMVPVVASGKSGRRAVFPMVWGYRIPGLNRPVVNARVETAAVKSAFQESWLQHRCVLPASWYYEWEHIQTPAGKTRAGRKFAIQPKNLETTWLAGLYRIEDDGFPYCVVLTREPGPDLARLHNRMPLIFPAAAVDAWIRPDARPEDLLPMALTEMVAEEA